MTDRVFLTDSTSGSLEYVGDEPPDDVTDAPSDLETVTLDTQWERFFGTDTFVQFDATLAQPIEQPYLYDGELHTFRKDESELRDAQAQIQQMPWTLDHPPNNRVTHPKQIRGFWDDPRYDDGQEATLHVPVTDTEAIRYALENDEVSIGFSAALDWEADAVDAVQRDMVYDHGASVKTGRCPRSEGCGLHVGDSPSDGSADDLTAHGHVFSDALQTEMTEESQKQSASDPQFTEGEWVAWIDDEGTRRHGVLATLNGSTASVTPYNPTTKEATGEAITVPVADLREWVGPEADSCPGDGCSCGCHSSGLLADGLDPLADAPDGIYVEDGNWYGIAPSETADDKPKYDLNNCNDVKDAFNLRNSGDYDVEQSTLVARIKRAADSHDCPPEQKPWADSTDDPTKLLADYISNT